MKRRLALSAALFLLLADPGTAALAESPAAVSIDHAWARATPGPATVGAAYLTVTAPAGDHLVSATSPVAGVTEIHSMTMDGTVMKMRPVTGGLDVVPGKPLVLAPDGFHIMLKELKHSLKVGQTFPLTLTFQKAGAVETTVTVGTAGAMGPGGASAPAPRAGPVGGAMSGMKM